MSRYIENNNWENTLVGMQKRTYFFVKILLNSKLSANHIFHNWSHTYNVVGSVQEICKNLNLTTDEEEIVFFAACFHDTGHIIKCIGHEEESKKIAEYFLRKNKYPEGKIISVIECINATKMPQSPVNLLGMILCDSDLCHLSSENYLIELQHLREEWSLIPKINYSEMEWLEMNLSFLKEHNYFTKYAQEVFENGKQSNIEKIEKIISEHKYPQK